MHLAWFSARRSVTLTLRQGRCLSMQTKVDSVVATILAIIAFELARFGRDGLAHLADQPDRALVEADHRPLGIERFGIEVEHDSHVGDIFAIDPGNPPHISAPRRESFSASRRRMVSPDKLS